MGACTRPCGRGGLDTSDGWFIAPPISSEETPPTPSPPSGEDCALLRSFLLSPRGKPRGGPGFPSRRKRDCARRRVSEANRREAAALRPETNGPCTVQKRKGSIAPAGGRKTGARWACLRFYACFQLTAWCGGALVVNAWTVRSSSLPLTWLWIVGPDSLVRPFPQGLPFSQ